LAFIGSNTLVEDTASPEGHDYGILSPATTVIVDNDERWLSGLTYPTIDAGASVTLAPISGMSSDSDLSGEEVISPDPNKPPYRFYYPFDIKASMKASTMGSTPEEIYANAESVIDTVTQKAIEIELWKGIIARSLTATDANGNRFMGAAAGTDFIDVTPSGNAGGVKPRYGQALLEQALGDATIGSKGVLHTPRLLASILKVKDSNGVLKTNLGTPVVAGAGYSLTGPDGQPAAAGKAWMFATGPMTVRLGPVAVLPGEVSQAVDTRINTITYYIDRAAAVTWSTSNLYAVLVDLTLDYA
jgi:hypothetical protein